jgi:hypothetical protein
LGKEQLMKKPEEKNLENEGFVVEFALMYLVINV